MQMIVYSNTSILAHSYDIIIYRGIGVPVNGRDFVNVLNTTYKRFISVLMANAQFYVSKRYDNQILMYTIVHKEGVSIERGF